MKPIRALIFLLLLAFLLVPLYSSSVLADQQPPQETSFPQLVTITYTNNTPVAVPDGISGTCGTQPGAPATSTITVPVAISISDLNVALNISAAWVGDVIVRLTSPAGTTITLVDQPGVTGVGCGFSSDNLITTLDDESGGGPVENGNPPTQPSYTPQQALSTFDGQNAAGVWILTVIDASLADTATLNSWSLIISTAMPPVAVNDTGTVTAGSAVALPVTANDTDADGTINVGTVTVATAPICGTAVPDGAGGVLYTNTNTTCTTDAFTYTVRDNDGAISNPASVSITINAAPPVAVNDTGTVTAGGAATIPVTANDTDVDGTINPARVAIVTAPACGTAVPDGSGGVLYTNTNTACTTDTFTYTVQDDDGLTSNAASVAITINPAPPVAANDTGTVSAGSAATIPVTANDTDVDGTIAPTTVAIVTAPTCGTAVPDGAGGVLYTNTDTTCMTDTFTYTVQDGDGLTSNTASVLVGIDRVPPVAVDDPVTITAGGAVTVPVTANDTDIDGTINPASVAIVTAPACGTAVADGAGGVLYTNTDTTCVTDTFTYTVQDDDGLASLPASVLIGIDAPPPTPPAPVVVELPPPPPAPMCNDMDFDEDAVVRAWIPDAYRHAVYCHLIVENGSYLFWYGGQLTHAGQIGVASVLEQGVIHAVDVFSPTGLGWYEGGAVVCLRGAGKLWFMPAAGVPRSAQDMTEYEVEEFAGFTCTTLYMPGTLVLTGGPLSQADSSK